MRPLAKGVTRPWLDRKRRQRERAAAAEVFAKKALAYLISSPTFSTSGFGVA